VAHGPTGTPKVQIPENNTIQASERPRTEPGPPDQAKSSPRTRTATVKGDVAVDIVRPAGDIASVLAAPARRGRTPVAHASQAAPSAGRRWWHVMYQCGACGGTHFGRSPVELKTGKRLARCGRVVWLKIARTYRPKTDQAGAR
jgi:hypothetical protein